MENAIERLIGKMKRKHSRIVVGLDPNPENIPEEYEGNVREYGEAYIKQISKYVPAIKMNSAFFEEEWYYECDDYWYLAHFAKAAGLITIADVKRADIGSTSKAYAEAFLGDHSPFDFITVNPYFGTDGIQPFIDVAVQNNKGIFVVVKTSNKSSEEIQNLELKDGKKVYHKVAELVDEWGRQLLRRGERYSPVGAVVGATHSKEAEELRKMLPNTFFLVPGYGVQGATAKDVSVNFDSDGFGAIVNSSRGIMCAYQKPQYEKLYELKGWRATLEAAVIDANKEINQFIK